MSTVTVTFDLAGLEKLRSVAFEAIQDLGHDALEKSNRVVPIEEGTLANSGTVTSDKTAGVVQVSYDTPYAVVQHEDQSLRHNDGRKAKFLEDVMLQEIAPDAEAYIAGKIREALR